MHDSIRMEVPMVLFPALLRFFNVSAQNTHASGKTVCLAEFFNFLRAGLLASSRFEIFLDRLLGHALTSIVICHPRSEHRYVRRVGVQFQGVPGLREAFVRSACR